jgi:hypothetical protein
MQTEHFFLGGHLPDFQHTCPALCHHTVDEWEHLFCAGEQALHFFLARSLHLLHERMLDVFGLVNHLLRCGNQTMV